MNFKGLFLSSMILGFFGSNLGSVGAWTNGLTCVGNVLSSSPENNDGHCLTYCNSYSYSDPDKYKCCHWYFVNGNTKSCKVYSVSNTLTICNTVSIGTANDWITYDIN